MLLLHGFGADCYTWRHVVPPLSRHYRAITLDLKGFGHSPKPADNAYSIRDQAEIVTDFIRRHDLRGLTLIGHSLGGAVALTANGNGFQVSLLAGASPVRWRAVAKDGADLPPAQAIEQEARLVVAVEETYDFEFEPTTKGDLRLEVLRPRNRTWTVAEVQVR